MKASPFPTRLLPEPIRSYVIEAAKSLGCPAAYVAPHVLATAAAAIGSARRIVLKKTWSEPAVVWAAVVAETGTVKSPAFDLGTKPAVDEQKRISRLYATKLRAYQSELKRWKSSARTDRGDQPDPPQPCEHVMCSDITIEGLVSRLQDTPKGTLIAVDELVGWFGSFVRYKSAGSDESHWLSLYNARYLKVDRKGGDRQTMTVDHAAACVTGTIQPETLRGILTEDRFASGLAARILLVMPNRKVKEWTDDEVSDATQDSVNRLFRQLFDLKLVPGPNGDEPKLVDLTSDAKHVFTQFFNSHNCDLQSLDGREQAAGAKLEAYAARFALIFHCIRQATAEKTSDYVDADDMIAGINLSKWFGEEAGRTYAVLSESPGDSQRRKLIEWISLKGGRTTVCELMRGPRRYRNNLEIAEKSLRALVAAKLCRVVIVGPGEKGGAAKEEFHLIDTDERLSIEGGDGDETPETYGKLMVVAPAAMVNATIGRMAI